MTEESENIKEEKKNEFVRVKPKKTIFIFGISSFLGSSLAEYLKKDFNVIGSYCGNPISIEGVLTFPMDVSSRDAIQLALYNFRPDITIYAVGLTSLENCARNEKLADALNTTGLFTVASFTERYKSKLIYLSSAYVFSGEKVTFLEDDTPMANTVYGKSKGAAEFFIQKTCLNYLIFRCCEFYGRSLVPGQNTWFEILQKKLFKGEGVNADNNIRTGYLDPLYLSMIIKICIDQDVTNRLFQISSQDIMSRYELSQAYAEVFHDKKDLISKGSWNFPELQTGINETSAANGLEYQIDIENIESYLNVKMPDIKESLELTKYRFGGEKAKKFSLKKGSEITFI